MRCVSSIPLLILFTTLLLVGAPVTARATSGSLDQSELFFPDAYPSQAAAAKGLARRLVTALKGSKEFDPDQHVVTICGDVAAESINGVTETLIDEFPTLRVDPRARATSQSGDQAKRIQLGLRADVEGKLVSPFRTRQDLTRGTVTLDIVAAPVQQKVMTARYVDKPWVDDWSAFSAGQTKGRWITAQNEFLLGSEELALDRARWVAAKALWPLVQRQMNDRNAGRPGAIWVKEQWVRSQLESLLARGEHVTDTFVQTYERPYGRAYRASILVDTSPDDIDAMAVHCAKLAKAEFGGKVVTWGSTAAMSAVILLLYFFVNSVTKGYFAWRLRAVALLLGIAGILIVLAVR